MIYCIPTDTCYWLAANIFSEEDYTRIYELKWRGYHKPLAFLVKKFDDINSIINITNEQIEFLKKYPYPFTIMWNINKNFKLPSFINKKIYSKIAIRVAKECIDHSIIEKLEYPCFLTSANYSWEKEIYSYNNAKEIFWKHEWVLVKSWITKNYPPSNIFNFIWNTVELNFLRQNY